MGPRRSAALVLGLLLAFGALVLLGGSLNSGYSHSRDYVSSLAGRGTDYAWVSVLAIASFAAAHAVASTPWWSRSRLVWVALVGCAASLVVVALARASCPGGAARCALAGASSVTDGIDSVHGAAIGIYALLFLVTAGVTAAVLFRRRGWRQGAAASVLAVLSLLALAQVDEATPGAEQRVWLAVNALSLLALTVLAASVRPREGVTTR